MEKVPCGEAPNEDFVLLGTADHDIGLFAHLCHPGGAAVPDEGVEDSEGAGGGVDAEDLHGLVFGGGRNDAGGFGAGPPDLVGVGFKTGDFTFFGEIEKN